MKHQSFVHSNLSEVDTEEQERIGLPFALKQSFRLFINKAILNDFVALHAWREKLSSLSRCDDDR
jgi:hypothetical protein